ncbi:MAG: C39 family peptidase [Patescibacteria group bacterium]
MKWRLYLVISIASLSWVAVFAAWFGYFTLPNKWLNNTDALAKTVEIKTNPSAGLNKINVFKIPFTPQAPYAKWDALHQEACEEASMIMVAEYFKQNKKLQLPADYAEKEILKLVTWEEKNVYTMDVTASEVVKILKDYFNLEAKVVPYNVSVLRAALLKKQPVLIPAAGRKLGNPYFHRPGPLYHMLVIKGFQGNEFITNDPGTKRGENFRYTEKILNKAVHDWNGGAVDKGEQVMIIISGYVKPLK